MQPLNTLAPFGVNLQNGGYISVHEQGMTIAGGRLEVETIVFKDGSTAQSSGGVSPGSDASFSFAQNQASAVWHIIHNLGKFPSVTVFDSSNHQVFGDVTQNSANDLIVTFSAPFSGTAHLN